MRDICIYPTYEEQAWIYIFNACETDSWECIVWNNKYWRLLACMRMIVNIKFEDSIRTIYPYILKCINSVEDEFFRYGWQKLFCFFLKRWVNENSTDKSSSKSME